MYAGNKFIYTNNVYIVIMFNWTLFILFLSLVRECSKLMIQLLLYVHSYKYSYRQQTSFDKHFQVGVIIIRLYMLKREVKLLYCEQRRYCYQIILLFWWNINAYKMLIK